MSHLAESSRRLVAGMCDLRVALNKGSDSPLSPAPPEGSRKLSDGGELPGVCLEQTRRSITEETAGLEKSPANGELYPSMGDL